MPDYLTRVAMAGACTGRGAMRPVRMPVVAQASGLPYRSLPGCENEVELVLEPDEASLEAEEATAPVVAMGGEELDAGQRPAERQPDEATFEAQPERRRGTPPDQPPGRRRSEVGLMATVVARNSEARDAGQRPAERQRDEAKFEAEPERRRPEVALPATVVARNSEAHDAGQRPAERHRDEAMFEAEPERRRPRLREWQRLAATWAERRRETPPDQPPGRRRSEVALTAAVVARNSEARDAGQRPAERQAGGLRYEAARVPRSVEVAREEAVRVPRAIRGAERAREEDVRAPRSVEDAREEAVGVPRAMRAPRSVEVAREEPVRIPRAMRGAERAREEDVRTPREQPARTAIHETPLEITPTSAVTTPRVREQSLARVTVGRVELQVQQPAPPPPRPSLAPTNAIESRFLDRLLWKP